MSVLRFRATSHLTLSSLSLLRVFSVLVDVLQFCATLHLTVHRSSLLSTFSMVTVAFSFSATFHRTYLSLSLLNLSNSFLSLLFLAILIVGFFTATSSFLSSLNCNIVSLALS